ncbi:YraN family protein [Bacterioplanoides sp. SCSIO 12839]|uniref:YraN family protein n=1 Tax=Bacterioplanoides sp. SCSIO 12839 TaxID=2829569 RepID=UPI0021073541|nr:YraN family protein [Bacterioplanoides sp. SCSIO 12839]UTW49232.1 YraN family protein [Bacterioplanoides sp. SCSIO 12839]
MWFKSSSDSSANPSLDARNPQQKRHYGEDIEQLAQQWLIQQGLQPLESNYGIKAGEIDLIMQHDQVLVFIEVRYRADNQHGSGAETITYQKQRKLRKTAEHYLQKNFGNTPPDCRFDVISATGKPVVFEWIQNAF